jgi:hypothetical protein
MGRRWLDAMEKTSIGGINLLIRWRCMLVVAERCMDGEIIIFKILVLH